VPAGRWLVLRMGHTLAGGTTRSSQPEATGLECDKLSKSAIEAHFAAMVGKLLADVGPLAGKTVVSISEIGANPARIDTRNQFIPDEETGEMIQVPCEMPIWVDPVTEGGTPMCHMLYHAHEVLSGWIAQHPRSFPPIVVHITDGESQDGDPTPYADAIKRLATEDGNVLLFNCHLSMTAAEPFMFPSSGEGLPDHLAQVLFQMSSELPDPFFRHATAEGFPLQPGARGMAFNADMVCLIQFLNMGTQAAPGLR